MEIFTKAIISSPLPSTDSWKTGTLTFPNLLDIIKNARIGYYHSRLIFTIELANLPKDILDIRKLE